MTDDRNVSWLVANRSRIQHLLLELHRRAPRDDKDRAATGLFQLLVGAGFALWRAVFLTDAERTAPVTVEHARIFLLKLIADNAITYTQESSTRAWTVGFYVNNAYFRLQLAYRRTSPTALSAQIDAFVTRQGEPGQGSSDDILVEPWRIACDAFEELVLALPGDA